MERIQESVLNELFESAINPIQWIDNDNHLQLLDQSRLPQEEKFLRLNTWEGVFSAIKDMKVRGAPAIGVSAGYALALACFQLKHVNKEFDLNRIADIGFSLMQARPTAVYLMWAVERMIAKSRMPAPQKDLATKLLEEAKAIHLESYESDVKLSEFGADVIQYGSSVLTHCNTGPLATGGFGTALGVIRKAWEQGKIKEVISTETRPWFQGSRLTMWELNKFGIPSTLIVDSLAGYLMSRGEIQCVIVGADRIASNGDVANKIGTFSLAVLAKEHGLPFYVAAPITTIDLDKNTGDEIPIEERLAEEVITVKGISVGVPESKVLNIAFDITPSKYITSIITDNGVASAPYNKSIKELIIG